MTKSYYSILGIHSHATQADVKAAFRRLAKEYHPDRHPGAVRPFQDVQEAYSVLSNEGKRRDYDDRLSAERRPLHPAPRGRPRPQPWPEPFAAGRPQPEPLIPNEGPLDSGGIASVQSFGPFPPSWNPSPSWVGDYSMPLKPSRQTPVICILWR